MQLCSAVLTILHNYFDSLFSQVSFDARTCVVLTIWCNPLESYPVSRAVGVLRSYMIITRTLWWKFIVIVRVTKTIFASFSNRWQTWMNKISIAQKAQCQTVIKYLRAQTEYFRANQLAFSSSTSCSLEKSFKLVFLETSKINEIICSANIFANFKSCFSDDDGNDDDDVNIKLK